MEASGLITDIRHMKKLERISDFRAVLGECPVWDSGRKIIYWVDIISKKLFSFNIENEICSVTYFKNFIGCVALRKNGQFIVASEEGIHFFDQNNLSVENLFNPEAHLEKNRFNDGKCDAAGRFWAGSTSYGENEKIGSLYCIDKDLNYRRTVTDVTVSNGISWSPDNKILYYIDSPTREVKAYEYDIKNGEIKNERVVIRFSEKEGYPDGMTTDQEGKLWIANWGGYKVGRWDPVNGKMIEKIDIPVERVSSVTFGGPGLDELFITTAAKGFNEMDKKVDENLNELDGMLFRIKVDVCGIDTYRFYG